jgi:hypothetical protein
MEVLIIKFLLFATLVGLVVALVKKPAITLTLLGLLVFAALAGFVVRQSARQATMPRPMPVVAVATPTTGAAQPTTQWVDDWEGFLNSAPAGSNWLRGESGLEATEADARRQAVENLARQIVPLIPRGRPGMRSDAWLHEQIVDSLNRVEIPVRFHVIKTTRPYGEIWQAKVITNASPQLVQRNLVDRYIQTAQIQRQTWRNQMLAMGAMLGIIILLYLFLNMATKGYFIWRLRAAAVMALIIAMLATLAWI